MNKYFYVNMKQCFGSQKVKKLFKNIFIFHFTECIEIRLDNILKKEAMLCF